MRLFILITLLLTSCVDNATEPSIDNVSINEVGQKLNGFWKLKEAEAGDGTRKTDFDPDMLTLYEFEGSWGVMGKLEDNHNGSFNTWSCEPTCQLKQRGDKIIIEYNGFLYRWELIIVKLSESELVLSDAMTLWTYERGEY